MPRGFNYRKWLCASYYLASTLALADPQVDCLAKNIYFEARGEGLDGMIAVADVTLNRVKSKKYPNTVCEVVTQGYTPGKLHGCQFSWYCDGKSDYPKNKEYFRLSKIIAEQALEGAFQGATNGATHYHATRIQPRWDFTKLEHTLTINNHIFYKYEI